jgi:hypothetical protein
MNSSFDGLRADIRRELRDLERVLEQTKEVLAHEEWPDLAFNRTLGSLLHDFYTGVEKIFQRITLEMEGSLPAGPDWHIQLLRRMSTPIDQVRPAVLDDELAQRLGEYLRFRHVFRVVYGFELSRDRLQELAANLYKVFTSLDAQLGRFVEFLEMIDKSTEDP